MWRVRFPLSAKFFTNFYILVNPLLFFLSKKNRVFQTNLGFFDKLSLFYSKIILFTTQLKKIGISYFFSKIDKQFFDLPKKPKKPKSSLVGQKNQLKMKQFDFFENMGTGFLNYFSFFPGHKMRFYLENTSKGTSRSVIPRLMEYREAQLVLSFFYVATHVPPKLYSAYPSFRPPSK